MSRLTFKTNGALWAIATLLLFCVVTCTVKLPIGKGEGIIWEVCTPLINRGQFPDDGPIQALAFLAFWSFLFLVPSLLVAWVAQAIVVMLAAHLRGRPQQKSQALGK